MLSLGRHRLTLANLRRIARGLRRFVIDCPEPFIVPYWGGGRDRAHSTHEPLRTQTDAQPSAPGVPSSPLRSPRIPVTTAFGSAPDSCGA